jgi:hypothetical protein
MDVVTTEYGRIIIYKKRLDKHEKNDKIINV